MKKAGILNRHLAAAMAELGHTDQVVVCDAGLPIPYGPQGPRVVDLSLTAGVPGFATVLDAVLAELEVEGATAASEVRDKNPQVATYVEGLFSGLELVPHEEFKQRVHAARLVIRTGEVTPYANIILHCGVPF
ncbi:D-ribose pyranase [Streptomyces sp. N2-109]|uniref:D-ribose pyranase n=1 Tax=Streptomyces gossypii TaxID=2883101 RepID=A0ABT2JW82_9ACTN|nr:D-ribose pyranase [Streptomyces gossypii]MCT2591504.1 D-ribose pyranase [Streptomyces gossypii]